MLDLSGLGVLGASLDRRLQDGIGAAGFQRIEDLADPVEHERDRVGLTEVATVFREGRAHLRGGAIAVVGERVDDHRHARSEEHTSELQSLMRISYAVFCLKKKKQKKN